jgi:hypothetical protein
MVGGRSGADQKSVVLCRVIRLGSARHKARASSDRGAVEQRTCTTYDIW